jgi:hypothetical protein
LYVENVPTTTLGIAWWLMLEVSAGEICTHWQSTHLREQYREHEDASSSTTIALAYLGAGNLDQFDFSLRLIGVKGLKRPSAVSLMTRLLVH